MNKTSYLLAMLGVGLSMIGLGCQTTSDEELAAMDMVGYITQTPDDPVGGSTSNHLLPNTYHSNKYKLLKAMSHRLTNELPSRSPTQKLASAIYDTGLLDTDEGKELFQMAVECALADGHSIHQSNPSRTYTGKGLMSTTAGWYAGPLSTEQKEDVLRCVIARVNMYGDSVPILISGGNVTNQLDEDHASVNWVPDALWDVKITTRPTSFGTFTAIEEYAWPLADVRANEASSQCFSVKTAMQSRVCDQASSNCSFHVGELATSGRRAPQGQLQANDPTASRPVVQSWVNPSTIVDLYAGCLQNVPHAPAMNPVDAPRQP